MTDSEFVPPAVTGGLEMHTRLRSGRAVWAVLTPAVTLAASLAMYAVASRWMADAEFGLFAVGIAVLSTLIALVSLGTPVMLVRHLTDEGSAETRADLRAAACVVVVIATGALALVVVIGWLTGGWRAIPRISPGVWAWAVVGAAGTALTDLRVAIHQSSFSFNRQFLAQAAAAGMRLLGVAVAMTAVGPTHLAALAGYSVASLVAAVVMLRHDLARALRTGPVFLVRHHAELFRQSLPLTVSAILAVLTTQVDTLAASALLPAGALAQYAAATRLSLVHSTVIGGLTALALPAAASMHRAGEGAQFVRWSVGLGTAAGLLALIFSLVAGTIVTVALFGVEYLESARLFLILSAGLLLNYPGNPVSQILYVGGRAPVMAAVQVIQIAVFLFLTTVLLRSTSAETLAVVRSTINAGCVLLVIGLAIGSVRGSRRPAS